jgi:hypothetical protein
MGIDQHQDFFAGLMLLNQTLFRVLIEYIAR